MPEGRLERTRNNYTADFKATRTCCDENAGEFAVICGDSIIFCVVNSARSVDADRVVSAINTMK